MPGPYTLAQLTKQVLEECLDPGPAGDFTDGDTFTKAKVHEVLNEGVGVFLENTRSRRKTWVMDVIAGQSAYDLSTLSPLPLDVLRVSLPTAASGTDDKALHYYAQEELEDKDDQWLIARGEVTGYMRWNRGEMSLQLYRIPDTGFTAYARSNGLFYFDSLYGDMDAMTGVDDTTFDSLYGSGVDLNDKYGAMTIEGTAGATTMTADSDTPLSTSGISPIYHACFRDYAVWRLLSMNSDLQQVQRAQDYLQRFQAKVKSASVITESGFQKKPLKRSVRESF